MGKGFEMASWMKGALIGGINSVVPIWIAEHMLGWQSVIVANDFALVGIGIMGVIYGAIIGAMVKEE